MDGKDPKQACRAAFVTGRNEIIDNDEIGMKVVSEKETDMILVRNRTLAASDHMVTKGLHLTGFKYAVLEPLEIGF